MRRHSCLQCILPPHILKKLRESKDKAIRDAAWRATVTTVRLRAERQLLARFGFITAFGGTAKRRSIFDCQQSASLQTASLVRGEKDGPTADASVTRAYDGLGATYDFYKQVLGRNSIDGKGMRLDAYVHYDAEYNNAFWDGREMVFGDGDGVLFSDFTLSLDVIGHELTHGVTEHTAGLLYENQPGALNESMSDVFGSLVKQWSLGQDANAADWLVGAELFTPAIQGDALRSLKAPGTAYDDPQIGKDPQPDHMDRFVQLPNTEDGDWGGVHINSGIPNKAFYLLAVALGGNAWDAPGQIWYEALKASNATSDFQSFADATHVAAGARYGAGSAEQRAVVEAWRQVGIRIAGTLTAVARVSHIASAVTDGVASLRARIEEVAAELKQYRSDLGPAKGRRS